MATRQSEKPEKEKLALTWARRRMYPLVQLSSSKSLMLGTAPPVKMVDSKVKMLRFTRFRYDSMIEIQSGLAASVMPGARQTMPLVICSYQRAQLMKLWAVQLGDLMPLLAYWSAWLAASKLKMYWVDWQMLRKYMKQLNLAAGSKQLILSLLTPQAQKGWACVLMTKAPSCYQKVELGRNSFWQAGDAGATPLGKHSKYQPLGARSVVMKLFSHLLLRLEFSRQA